ncbi:MAG TPA: hypothetical protein P5105_01890 [Victivallales bacterium]|nr:hypothetical protein [Victivallales bacterium]HRR06008.1 hypothetical protein [Victivallales bacterium]HRR29171.1 hypothetical protein [Victivallales bacterium]HRU00981.1 hypothetical protein [Victivallales bacterium]
MIGALLILFLSEAILREASVASLKTKEKDLDSILASVPSFLRGRIKSRIEMMQLRDAVTQAKTDQEKINALSALAAYIKDEDEKEKLYLEILKLPRMVQSYPAMIFFLEKDISKHKISIEEYHNFIFNCPTLNRYSLWSIGLQELKDKKKERDIQLKYLMPLLSIKPDFYDYKQLYRTIYELAVRLDDKETAKKADELSIICEELPTIFEETERIEKEKMSSK